MTTCWFRYLHIGQIAHAALLSVMSALLLYRLLLQELHLEGALHDVAQVFFLTTGDSFVEDVSAMGLRHGCLTLSGLQRVLEETMKASPEMLRIWLLKPPMSGTV